MSHVSEGALHAYLDGALDEYPAAEARETREHLESCAACARRLEEERTIRQDATAMLGLAVPDVELPSFEELRAYVKAMPAPPTRASVRLQQMGWAASVVVALGVGWMVREGQLERMPVTQPSVQRPVSLPVDDVVRGVRSGGDVADLLESTTDANRRAADVATTVGRAAGPSLERLRVAPGVVDDVTKEPAVFPDVIVVVPAELESQVVAENAFADLGDRGARALRLEEALTPMSLVVAEGLDSASERKNELDRVAGAGGAADELSVDEATPESVARAVQAPLSAPAPPEERAAASRRSDTRELTAANLRVERSRDFAASADGRNAVDEDFDEVGPQGSLVVPGLSVISYANVAEGTIPRGIHVIQSLENDEVLDVYHLPEGVAPSSLPPLENGRNEVRAERDGGWVILRAALPTDALRELLARLGPEG